MISHENGDLLHLGQSSLSACRHLPGRVVTYPKLPEEGGPSALLPVVTLVPPAQFHGIEQMIHNLSPMAELLN